MSEITPEILAALEALLFIHGEPLATKKIGELLNLPPEVAQGAVDSLGERLNSEERGLRLILNGERVQLATKPAFNPILKSFVKAELAEELTLASLETLSLIAYLGPIARAELEYIRGVNSAFILRSLMLRGLVERIPHPNQANNYMYQASFELIKHLGVGRLEDLPDYTKFNSILKKAGEEKKDEAN